MCNDKSLIFNDKLLFFVIVSNVDWMLLRLAGLAGEAGGLASGGSTTVLQHTNGGVLGTAHYATARTIPSSYYHKPKQD